MKINNEVGYGLYSKKYIREGTLIQEYHGVIGKFHKNKIFTWKYPSLFNHQKIYLEAGHFGNCLKYINDLHYHNVKAVYLIKKDFSWGVFYYSI